MMTVAELKGYISAREAAARLGVAKRTVYGYIERGLLPADRVGRAVLIPVRALECFKKPLPGNPTFRKKRNDSGR